MQPALGTQEGSIIIWQIADNSLVSILKTEDQVKHSPLPLETSKFSYEIGHQQLFLFKLFASGKCVMAVTASLWDTSVLCLTFLGSWSTELKRLHTRCLLFRGSMAQAPHTPLSCYWLCGRRDNLTFFKIFWGGNFSEPR